MGTVRVLRYVFSLNEMLYEYTDVLLLGVYLIVFVTTLFRTPKLDEYQLDQDAQEDEEEGLLASTGRRFGATWQDLTGRAKQQSGDDGA